MTKRNYFCVALFSFALMFFYMPLSAQETEDLVNMSFEDLLNLEVTTASKKAQDINFAPADITVITEQTNEKPQSMRKV